MSEPSKHSSLSPAPSRFPRRPKLGHAGPPELGQWGERAEGRGNTEGIEEKLELLSPRHSQVPSEQGGFFAGKTTLYAVLEK